TRGLRATGDEDRRFRKGLRRGSVRALGRGVGRHVRELPDRFGVANRGPGRRSRGFRGTTRAIARQEAVRREAEKTGGAPETRRARGKKAVIEKLIAACVRNKFLTLIFAAGVFGAGIWA